MTQRPPENGPKAPSKEQQVEDAEFLMREFDMNPEEASGLVARDGLPPDKLKQEIVEPDGKPALPDPLGGVPVPSSPRNELTRDADEQARKPVVHRHRNTQGAG